VSYTDFPCPWTFLTPKVIVSVSLSLSTDDYDPSGSCFPRVLDAPCALPGEEPSLAFFNVLFLRAPPAHFRPLCWPIDLRTKSNLPAYSGILNARPVPCYCSLSWPPAGQRDEFPLSPSFLMVAWLVPDTEDVIFQNWVLRKFPTFSPVCFFFLELERIPPYLSPPRP